MQEIQSLLQATPGALQGQQVVLFLFDRTIQAGAFPAQYYPLLLIKRVPSTLCTPAFNIQRHDNHSHPVSALILHQHSSAIPSQELLSITFF
jgi:hypothetical protein